MRTFWIWFDEIIQEAQRPQIDPAVLSGYEHAFKDELQKLIQKTQNPELRAKLIEMLDCPIRTSRGCRSFTDYILGALIKNGIHERFDIEAALGYVFEKMMMEKGDAGQPRTTVFGGFEERPDAEGNPLQARFMKYLTFAVNNIRKGKIVRLAHAGQWPPGTVSIGQGRRKDGDPGYGISPDEIKARPSSDADMAEMVEDIEILLRKKEPAYGFPLVKLFQAIMGGMNVVEQRKQFGDRKVRPARQAIIQTIEDYAKSTDNVSLQRLLQRITTGQAEEEIRRTPAKTPRPMLSEKERDYTSIVNVVARFDRPVGTADLGRFRRRWLEYPPRDLASVYRNRLEEVLAKMSDEGVLQATRRSSGATVFEPGPAFQQYHHEIGAAV